MKNYSQAVVLLFMLLGIIEPLRAQSISLNEDQIKRYTEAIIFDTSTINNGQKCIFIDSALVYRPTLPPIFTHEEKFDIMLDSYSLKPIPLTIPDSLKECFKFYRSSQIRDIMKDTVTVSLFSPLLPTKEAGVYILQEYCFIYTPDGNSRIAAINFYKYKFENGKLVPSSPLAIALDVSSWEGGTTNGW